MQEAVLGGLLLCMCDSLLCVCMWVGLVLVKCPSCGGLGAVWALGLLKWVILYGFASILTNGKPPNVLRRFVVLLSLIQPVYETLRIFYAPHMGTCPDLGMLFLGPVSSALACSAWERFLSGDGNIKKEKLDENWKSLLLRMLKYFKPDTFYLIAAFGFLILGVICDTYIPLYQGKVIDMLREGIFQPSFYYAVGQLSLFSFGSAVFGGLRGGIFMCTLARLNRRLKHLLFHTLLQQEVHFFDENKPGRLSSRLHSDVDRMGRTVALNANALVRSSVKSLLMLRLMLGLSWQLTALTCVEMPLLGLIQNTYNTWSKELKEQLQDCHAVNKDLASQTISNIQTVRSFKAEAVELSRYTRALEHMGGVKRRSGIYSAVFLIIRRVVTLGIKLLMLVQARSLILSDQLSIGSLVAFFLYQKPMSNNLREIMYCYGETVSTMGVISKVFSYLDRSPQCKEAGELAPENLEGRIEFQNVTFTYPTAEQDKPALKSVCFSLRPGHMTALVGPNGSGKTSCVSLLKRLYEPQQGAILMDGQPLDRYQHKYFHQKVALVSQNPLLFSGSLRYNIEYGLTDCSMRTVEEAAKKTNADQFISELENGYDTDVGERGSKLSDGQKQSIAIVRALVRDPQVIILDEATSKLDVQVQHAVLKEVLSCGRTVLVVAHQLKTVEKADHIIFMEGGEVVEEGTHSQLMDRRGRYHRLKEELFSQDQ